MTELPSISLPRVTLRQLTMTDRNDLLAVYADQEAMEFRQGPPLVQIEDADRMIEESHQHLRSDTSYRWAIEDRNTHEVIGTFIWKKLDRDVPDYVGYALRKDKWGQGFMSEVLSKMVPYLHFTHGIAAIRAEVDERNTPSIRLLERCGFTRIERSQIGRCTYQIHTQPMGDTP